MRFYPVNVQPETDEGFEGFYGTFVQDEVLPGVAEGKTVDDVLTMLGEMLLENIEMYVNENIAIPDPLPVEQGQYAVMLPTLVEAKVLLHNARVKRGLNKSELGRLTGISAVEMGRILDPRHGTKIEAIDRIMQVLETPLRLSV